MNKPYSRDVVLFDLDGTLININSIQQLLGEWEEFHPATFDCPANEPMIEFAKLCQKMGLALLIVSGKPVTYLQHVTDWLAKRGIIPDVILMRPAISVLGDAELKPALAEAYLGEGWQDRVLFAIEDRDKMVDAWRANGVMCLQCDESLY